MADRGSKATSKAAPVSISAFNSRVGPKRIVTLWPLWRSNSGTASFMNRRMAPPLKTEICATSAMSSISTARAAILFANHLRRLFSALSFRSPSRTRLSAVATMASSFERGAQAQHAPGLFVGGVLHLAEFGQDLLHRRIAQRGEAHQPVGQLPGRHSSWPPRPCGLFSTLAMSSIDMKSPATARKRSPLAAG